MRSNTLPKLIFASCVWYSDHFYMFLVEAWVASAVIYACTTLSCLCFSLGYSSAPEWLDPVLWPRTWLCEVMWEQQPRLLRCHLAFFVPELHAHAFIFINYLFMREYQFQEFFHNSFQARNWDIRIHCYKTNVSNWWGNLFSPIGVTEAAFLSKSRISSTISLPPEVIQHSFATRPIRRQAFFAPYCV